MRSYRKWGGEEVDSERATSERGDEKVRDDEEHKRGRDVLARAKRDMWRLRLTQMQLLGLTRLAYHLPLV